MSEIIIENLTIAVIRKRIKNIYLRVYPASGRISISAPAGVSDEAIQKFARSKLPWLQKQMTKAENLSRQKLENQLKYVSGEQHYIFGIPYTLAVIIRSSPTKVLVKQDQLVLITRPQTGPHKREQLINHFYRETLKKTIPGYIDKWEKLMKVQVREFGVKRMKTRWGSCNRRARRIWINLELAKKKPVFLEYIIVHEMIHLLEKNHNQRFYRLMDRFLPEWKDIRKELNNGQLTG